MSDSVSSIPAPAAPSAQNQLQAVFNFTPEDLAANRQGQATPRQITNVKQQVGQSRILAVVVIFIVLAIAAGAFMFAPNFAAVRNQLTNGGQNSAILIAGLGGSLLLYLVAMGYSLIRSGRSASGRVSVLTGAYRPLGGLVRALDGTIYQRASFGRRQMLLKQQQASVFVPRQTYTLYVAGSGMNGQILSVEPPTGSAAAVLDGSQAPFQRGVNPLTRIGGVVLIVVAIVVAVIVALFWTTLGDYVVHFTFLGWNVGFLGAQLVGVLMVLVFAVRGAQMALARR